MVRSPLTMVVLVIIFANYVIIFVISVLQSLLVRNSEYIQMLKSKDFHFFLLEQTQNWNSLYYSLISPILLVNYIYYLAIVQVPASVINHDFKRIVYYYGIKISEIILVAIFLLKFVLRLMPGATAIILLNFKKTSSNQLNLVDSLIFEFLIRFITWKFLLGLIEENQKNFKSLLK